MFNVATAKTLAGGLRLIGRHSHNLCLLSMYITVQHNVADDCSAASGSRLRGHGGADFYAVDAFVHAISVCIYLNCLST